MIDLHEPHSDRVLKEASYNVIRKYGKDTSVSKEDFSLVLEVIQEYTKEIRRVYDNN